MMEKYEVLKRIDKSGIIAVVRAKDFNEAKKISLACMNGGIDAIEIAFTVPNAQYVIESLVKEFGDKLLVGAGTVLDSETARIAILAGAKYIVSPAFNPQTAKLCNRYQIPYMAGCMTLTEILTALEAGTDIIKIFPGNILNPSFVSAIKGPLPQAKLMPTGGVNLENVTEWIKSGCIAVGVGGNLTKGSSDDITNTAKAFIAKIKEAKSI
ncbi:bifunctional 2-keto-4-hydroxyglutarate aldolase/2-keto-3-deoxy-6-phosphogluconate aldolase [Clostridium thermopalmarium]|nr:bifunctional 2-keto-4-hydroxyglutarate aldolase/2-keto-3-deoxy-6-phosphogluconate aldolase [Clostridium thermopalmarium]